MFINNVIWLYCHSSHGVPDRIIILTCLLMTFHCPASHGATDRDDVQDHNINNKSLNNVIFFRCPSSSEAADCDNVQDHNINNVLLSLQSWCC